MSVLDFLFEGSAPPSTTTYGTTTQNIPQWLSDYTQGLIARANAVAAEPYQAYPGPRLAGLTPEQMQAYGIAGETPQATEWAKTALSAPGALSMASPYIAGAAQTFPGAVEDYMNPYTENVIDRASTLANRALTEQFLPALGDMFTTTGQYGSSRMQELGLQGVRDITEGLQEQANAELARAYESAGTMFGADANRLGALATTVGNLQGSDIARMGDLSQILQQLQIGSAGALEAAGAAQQGQSQQSLNLAYEDFLRQQGYPKEQVDWMSSIIRGIPYSQTATSTSTGPANVYQPSPLAQMASLLSAGAGIYDIYKNSARGGRITRRPSRYRRGGLVRGALSYAS